MARYMAMAIRMPEYNGHKADSRVYHSIDSITLEPTMRGSARPMTIVFLDLKEYERFIAEWEKFITAYDEVDGEFHIMNFFPPMEYTVLIYRTSNIS